MTSFAVGDLLYADTTTTLAKLADVATGNALISGGVGVAPAWGKIGLTTHVSGTLPTGNGGTGLASFTAGDMVYYASGTALSKLAIGAANTVMTSSGSAPQWSTSINLTTVIAGNLQFTGNTISSTDTNGNINLSPNGSGGVFLGTYATIGSGSYYSLTLNGSVASNPQIAWKIGGKYRFSMLNTGTESGGNVGGDLIMYRYDDAGSYLGGMLTFTRSNGNLTVMDGNLVIGTSGKGINFSAAGGDVLSTYDEGTWTPSDQSGAGLTFTSADGWFVRVGREVFAHYYITYPVTASVAANVIGGLPFTAGNTNAARGGSALTYNEFNAVTSIYGPKNTTLFALVDGVGNQKTNATMSAKTIMGCINYFL